MLEVLLIACAGGLGAVSRYGLSGLAVRALGNGFPYGTLIVNVLGCFAIGFLMQIGVTSDAIPRAARQAAVLGFLGAFTTFSAFGYETTRYMGDGAWGIAAANAAANLFLCILATVVGAVIGRVVVGGPS